MTISGRFPPVVILSSGRPLLNVKPTIDKNSRQPNGIRQLCRYEQPAVRGLDIVFERCRTQTWGVLALSRVYRLPDGNLRDPQISGSALMSQILQREYKKGNLVGVRRFELPAPASRIRCHTRLLSRVYRISRIKTFT